MGTHKIRLLKLALSGSGLSIGNLKDKTGVNKYTLAGVMNGTLEPSEAVMENIITVLEKEQAAASKALNRVENEASGYIIARESKAAKGIIEFMVDRDKTKDQWWTATNDSLLMVFRDKKRAESALKKYRGEAELWSATVGRKILSKQKACFIGGDNA